MATNAERGSAAELTVTLVGGPTAILEFGGLRLLTDATLDPPGSYEPRPGVTLRKTSGPAFGPDDVGRIDVVLLSHDHHVDNLDVLGTRVPGAGCAGPDNGQRR